MVDETKPAKWWRVYSCGGYWEVARDGACDEENEQCTDIDSEAEAIALTHRLSREEARPYVAEALERIAAWLESRAFEESRGELVGRFDRWLCRQVQRMARGERPLPGSEGGT